MSPCTRSSNTLYTMCTTLHQTEKQIEQMDLEKRNIAKSHEEEVQLGE